MSDKKLKVEKITPGMLTELPADVQQALKDAQAVLAEKARGRQSMPKPSLLTLPLEEGEEPLYAVVLPLAFHQIEALDAASKRGVPAVLAAALAEACFWVRGMPDAEADADPRKTAIAYLRELEKVPGPLGMARLQFANAILEMLSQPPEVSAGKL